jgi:hypothetical protein
MDMKSQNQKDNDVLVRLDLQPLEMIEDRNLAPVIQAYNARLAAVTSRFAKLAADRLNLSDFTRLRQAHAAVVRQEHERLLLESWDALVELDQVVGDYGKTLDEIRNSLHIKGLPLGDKREKAVACVSKSMGKVRRECVRANPERGEGYFWEEVNASELVMAVDKQITEVQQALESVQSRKYRIISNGSVVETRMREVFPYLLSCSGAQHGSTGEM